MRRPTHLVSLSWENVWMNNYVQSVIVSWENVWMNNYVQMYKVL